MLDPVIVVLHAPHIRLGSGKHKLFYLAIKIQLTVCACKWFDFEREGGSTVVARNCTPHVITGTGRLKIEPVRSARPVI